MAGSAHRIVTTRPPLPPFSLETAPAKVQAAEDAWNSRDPIRVAGACTPDSEWRKRDYRLRKELWAFHENRISVRFEYEWHDTSGQGFRTHDNEPWEFDEDGLMRRRDMSANDVPIHERDRCYRR